MLHLEHLIILFRDLLSFENFIPNICKNEVKKVEIPAFHPILHKHYIQGNTNKNR
jgi:hypothetical protein